MNRRASLALLGNSMARSMPPSDLARGIRSGDRATLARAHVLIESKRADHRAAHRLSRCCRLTGKSGIAGMAHRRRQSTTIDANLSHQRAIVAVLAVDPSSTYRRLDPRRQDAYGSRQRPRRLQAALTILRYTWRRRCKDP